MPIRNSQFGIRNSSPKVSVIISTFNGERYLLEALNSILNQTFEDFELIIVNDGSTDSTSKILSDVKDERLVLIENSVNSGIAASQNKAIAIARGEYLALQDHDDISLPERFQLQVDYLDRHPEIALVSSSCWRIDGAGTTIEFMERPAGDMEVKWGFLFGCPIFHTTVMLRRAVLDEGPAYSEDYAFACDYELLSRVVAKHQVAQMPQPLVSWRVHSGATSVKRGAELQEEGMKILRRNITDLVGSEIDTGTWSGVELLLLMKAGAEINISAGEVERAAILLLQLQEGFYRHYGFASIAARAHRRVFYRRLTRRFLALAGRTSNGRRNLASRLTLFVWATRVLALSALTFLPASVTNVSSNPVSETVLPPAATETESVI
jgi:glycosyltransferase involved in cell wall biosynthesis